MTWTRRLTTLAAAMAIASGGLFLIVLGPTAAGPAAASGPSCTFSPNGVLALVTGVTPGEQITINCTGLTPSHPYMQVEASLLVAIDPAAKPLLTGQATSVPGLLGIISALPELNATSVATPFSDSSGNLNTTYTVPMTQPTGFATGSTCPPTTQEFNSGLIGCVVAMLDLTTFKPVVPGTFILNYKSEPGFPPRPTLALTPSQVTRGQKVSVSDAPGATTYWWVATLASLFEGLSGSGGSGPIPVSIKEGAGKVTGSASASPATYNGVSLTPPALSGSFIAKGHGKKKVTVSLQALVEGFPLSNIVAQYIHVTK